MNRKRGEIWRTKEEEKRNRRRSCACEKEERGKKNIIEVLVQHWYNFHDK